MKTFAKFLVVGGFNTILGLGIIFTLYNLLKLDYRLANLLGYCVVIIISFYLNKYWTFNSAGNRGREFIWFVFIFVLSYLLNLFTVIGCVEWLKIEPNLSQVAGMMTYTLFNFAANKKITFSIKPD